MKKFKFSLVLCTLGRVDLLRDFIESLHSQEYKNFELIIVDQNLDERLREIIFSYSKSFEIKHVKSDRGLSKSRNLGLNYIAGDIVAFPDDDCVYPNELLKKVNDLFDSNDFDVLSIKMTNSISAGRKIQNNFSDQYINKKDVLKFTASISGFYRKEVIDSVGIFDENLGLGADTIFQGGEDYDYSIRVLEKGFKIYYKSDVEVLHPWDDEKLDNIKNLTIRSFTGGAAEMFLLNKHKFGVYFKVWRLFRRCFIVIYYLLRLNLYKAKLSYGILRGMIQHFNYRQEVK
jgi:glycosyltransferase involved in cell wall biosynthesis